MSKQLETKIQDHKWEERTQLAMIGTYTISSIITWLNTSNNVMCASAIP